MLEYYSNPVWMNDTEENLIEFSVPSGIKMFHNFFSFGIKFGKSK